jgi:hypothetical protein
LRIGLGIVAAIALVGVALVILFKTVRGQAHPVDGARLVAALAHYCQDVRKRGEPLPPTVALNALIQMGYLQPDDAKAFEGAKVIFNTQADEKHPQTPLMEARMPDGQVLVLLADGSVQTSARSSLEQLHLNSPQEAAPADVSQPMGLGTNRTSPAPGSPP